MLFTNVSYCSANVFLTKVVHTGLARCDSLVCSVFSSAVAAGGGSKISLV